MTLHVDGTWSGWAGDSIVQRTDGLLWRQAEYRGSASRAPRHHARSVPQPLLVTC
jgi:hypothetical protein